MDVLFVVEEDGNVWEIGFVASAEGVWDFCKVKGYTTHYAPVRCISKLVDMWSRTKAWASVKRCFVV